MPFCAGIAVTVIAIEKGSDLKDKVHRNFGSPNPEGYRKALRLMHQAEKFGRPVICFVDTAGAFCGIGAEERGQAQAIAVNLMEMMTLKVPILSILVGEGGSGGALALAVGRRGVGCWKTPSIPSFPPKACASILWKDPKRVQEASESLRLTSRDLRELGVVQKVLEEGPDFRSLYGALETQIWRFVTSRSVMPTEELLQRRYAQFRSYGAPAIV